MVPVFRTIGVAATLLGSALHAQSSAITETARTFSFALNGTTVTISRQGATCPGSCVQPMQISPGIQTLGELEVIAFLQSAVGAGHGLLVDVRKPDAFSMGSLPGAVNIPVSIFDPENPYRNDLFSALGVRSPEANPGFDTAFSLVIFGGGPDDKDAANAISTLVSAGYPTSKIQYYRGGARDWTGLGLNLAAHQ